MNVTGEHHGDPLAAIGGELVAAARRRASARRRRRRRLVVAALAGAMVMLTGAALAVTGVPGVSTGVPAIDDLLDRSQAPPSPEDDTSAPDGEPPVPQLRPASAESVSPPLAVTLPDGTQATAVGYRTVHGSICTALAREGDRRVGNIGCLGGRFFRRQLAREPARVIGGGGGPGGLNIASGFARPEVEAITARTPTERAEAQLSPTWKPDANTTVKMFYVFLEASDRSPRPPQIALEARLEDGTTVPVGP